MIATRAAELPLTLDDRGDDDWGYLESLDLDRIRGSLGTVVDQQGP